jgi:hypothetical protein
VQGPALQQLHDQRHVGAVGGAGAIHLHQPGRTGGGVGWVIAGRRQWLGWIGRVACCLGAVVSAGGWAEPGSESAPVQAFPPYTSLPGPPCPWKQAQHHPPPISTHTSTPPNPGSLQAIPPCHHANTHTHA